MGRVSSSGTGVEVGFDFRDGGRDLVSGQWSGSEFEVMFWD